MKLKRAIASRGLGLGLMTALMLAGCSADSVGSLSQALWGPVDDSTLEYMRDNEEPKGVWDCKCQTEKYLREAYDNYQPDSDNCFIDSDNSVHLDRSCGEKKSCLCPPTTKDNFYVCKNLADDGEPGLVAQWKFKSNGLPVGFYIRPDDGADSDPAGDERAWAVYEIGWDEESGFAQQTWIHTDGWDATFPKYCSEVPGAAERDVVDYEAEGDVEYVTRASDDAELNTAFIATSNGESAFGLNQVMDDWGYPLSYGPSGVEYRAWEAGGTQADFAPDAPDHAAFIDEFFAYGCIPPVPGFDTSNEVCNPIAVDLDGGDE